MLACARLGAPHSVVFGGFAPRRSRPDQRRRGQGPHHRRRRLPAGPGGSAEAERRRRGRGVPDDRARGHRPATGGEHAFTDGPRRLVPRPDGRAARRVPARADGRRGPAVHPVHVGTTGKPKGILHTTGGYLTGVATTHQCIFDIHDDDVYWCAADIGWVTGHSLHRVRAAGQPHHRRSSTRALPTGPTRTGCGRSSRSTARRSCTRRRPRSGRSCAGATEYPQAARPVLAPAARLGRRADQPRGLGLVLEVHRHRALPGRRHVVADRDRPDPDHAAAGDHALKPGSATHPFPGIEADIYDEQGHRCRPGGAAIWCSSGRGRGCSGRSTAIPTATWRRTSAVRPRHVPRGRRGQARRGRLLLAARPHRRRDERGRPPDLAPTRSSRLSSTTRRWPRRRWSPSRTRSSGRPSWRS